ncbi:MAG: hypothetical protein OXP12_08225, partial [Thaumarchaeota archaeon]|nr:hypothetical protein [Nitrososphaerota archaeon]
DKKFHVNGKNLGTRLTLTRIQMAGDTNNNQTKSFNVNTLRAKERVIQGIKRDGSIILRGLQTHHNHRPH